jgi:hypothetical protein
MRRLSNDGFVWLNKRLTLPKARQIGADDFEREAL